MAKDNGLHDHGPVCTPMTDIPGDPKNFSGDSGDIHDGVPGYPKGTGGKAPELTFVDDGVFGKVKPATRGE